MKYALLAVAVILVAFASQAPAHDPDGNHKYTGCLIDNACGDKLKDEAAAKARTTKCTLKDPCAASGFQIIVGEKHIKLSDAGNEKAKAYLAKNENTNVVIAGRIEDDKLEVASIVPAPKPKDAK